jgi:L-rhamnonate dehydratase
MKITDVRAVQPEVEAAPQDWRGWLGQILVRVDTDEGLTGYGVGGGGLAGIHVVVTVFRDLLVGLDPKDVEGIWDRMYRLTLPYGQKGLAIMAISGVDLALWDLRGKALGKSIVEVLGGTAGQAVPTYKTGWSPGEVLADSEQGYSAVKLQVGKLDGDEAVRQLGEMRESLGSDVQIMADAFMSWDEATALRVAHGIAEYDIRWLEEPLPADDLDGYERLCKQSSVPIAGGEHEYTAAAFEDLMKRGIHAIYQPDVSWCGGLTELFKIYEMACRYGVRVCPHRGSEIWALHAIVALDPDPLAESGRPWMTWVGGQPAIEGGTISLRDDPGFGVWFDQKLWEFSGGLA